MSNEQEQNDNTDQINEPLEQDILDAEAFTVSFNSYDLTCADYCIQSIGTMQVMIH